MSRIVAVYDIPDNKRRKRVADILESYGDRIQKSVFELPINRRLMKACLAQLNEVIDLKEDSFVTYRVCAACDKERLYLGQATSLSSIGSEEVFIV